jgi:hypothetical protein
MGYVTWFDVGGSFTFNVALNTLLLLAIVNDVVGADDVNAVIVGVPLPVVLSCSIILKPFTINPVPTNVTVPLTPLTVNDVMPG